MTDLQYNKTIVTRFYQMAFGGEPARAVELIPSKPANANGMV